MTALVPSGTDQPSRSRPPELVSPDTPALIISTSIPLSFKDFCSLAGKADGAGRPRPALSESPSTTILIGPAVAGGGHLSGGCSRHQTHAQHEHVREHPPWYPPWPLDPAAEVPYDPAMDSLIEPSSLAGLEPDSIAISNVNLSLGSGPARVHILKDISLRVASGEAIGLIGPSGSGKSTLLMVMAGLERPDSGEVVVNGTPFNASTRTRWRVFAAARSASCSSRFI